jgi:hypothetical protein
MIMAAITVTGETRRLLEQAVSKMDVLHHRMAAAEERERQERRDAQHRADAAAHLRSRDHLLEVQATARAYQQRADSAFEPWNMRAPPLMAGESLIEYRRRLARLAQKQLPEDHQLRGFKISRLDDDIFAGFEPQFFAAAKEAGHRPDSAAPGELRMVEKVNPSNGQKFIEFFGTRSFIHDLGERELKIIVETAPSYSENLEQCGLSAAKLSYLPRRRPGCSARCYALGPRLPGWSNPLFMARANSEPEMPECEERERADSLTSNVFGLIKRMLPTRSPPSIKPYVFKAFPKSSDW